MRSILLNEDSLEMWIFSMSPNQMDHERNAENIFDWISNIGGVFQVFFFVIYVMVSGYSGFLQNLSMIQSLKRIEDREKRKETPAGKRKRLKEE